MCRVSRYAVAAQMEVAVRGMRQDDYKIQNSIFHLLIGDVGQNLFADPQVTANSTFLRAAVKVYECGRRRPAADLAYNLR